MLSLAAVTPLLALSAGLSHHCNHEGAGEAPLCYIFPLVLLPLPGFLPPAARTCLRLLRLSPQIVFLFPRELLRMPVNITTFWSGSSRLIKSLWAMIS